VDDKQGRLVMNHIVKGPEEIDNYEKLFSTETSVDFLS